MNTSPSADLHQAMLHTATYADIFDYPLTAPEIHRYLAVRAPLDTVRAALPGPLHQVDGLYTLLGREAIVETRQRRQQIAARLWPQAQRFGAIIARLPFVRMVAVTGSLAMDNAEPNADLDYLIVSVPGRLWLCRALILTLARLAALQGVQLCPNYLVSQNALSFAPQTIYAAHELAQMVPLSGMDVYGDIRRRNRWLEDFLPNAAGAPRSERIPPQTESRTRGVNWLEALLLTRPVTLVEDWEMNRKIRKLSRENDENPEASFSADCCKGHSLRHGQKTTQKLESLLKPSDSHL